MTRPIQRTSLPPPTPAPSKPAAPAASEAPSPSIFEADVRLAVTGSAQVAADGSLTLRREFMTRLVRHLLRNPERFAGSQASWDAAHGAYAASTQFKLFGMPLPVSARAVPTAENGQAGFRLEAASLKLAGMTFSGAWLDKLLTQQIAKELGRSNVKTQVDPAKHQILLDADSLLQEIGALPGGARLNAAANRLDLRLDTRTGDVRVALTSGTNVPAASATPRSDMAVRFDPNALRTLLRGVLAGNDAFDLKDVQFQADGLTAKGQANVKPVSDLINAGKILAVLLSGQAGAQNVSAERVMIDLDLDAKIGADGIRLKPSLRQALSPLEAALTKAKARFTRDGDTLVIDPASLLPADVELEEVRMTPEGLLGKIHLDLPSLLNPPILRGER